MRQLAVSPEHEFSLTILSGPDKGVTYNLSLGQVSLGRGSENAIVIRHDAKVSRQHALLTVGVGRVELTVLNEKNAALVDGMNFTRGLVHHGSIIQIGATKLRINHLARQQALEDPKAINFPAQFTPDRRPSNTRTSGPQQSGLSPNFYIILGVLLLISFFFYNSRDGSKKKPTLISAEQIEKNIEAQSLVTESKLRELEARDKQNPQWASAQSQYVRGFRDFQKGQYDRAMESFQACVSLVPTHDLCLTYLETAKRKHAEIIQNQMEFGRKYKDQQQWNACAAAFRNVMVMVKDQSSLIFKEAQTNRRFCDLNAGEKY